MEAAVAAKTEIEQWRLKVEQAESAAAAAAAAKLSEEQLRLKAESELHVFKEEAERRASRLPDKWEVGKTNERGGGARQVEVEPGVNPNPDWSIEKIVKTEVERLFEKSRREAARESEVGLRRVGDKVRIREC